MGYLGSTVGAASCRDMRRSRLEGAPTMRVCHALVIFRLGIDDNVLTVVLHGHGRDAAQGFTKSARK